MKRHPVLLLSSAALVCILIGASMGLHLYAGANKTPLIIAAIPKTTATDYWESMHAGMLNAARGHSITIFWNAPQSEADYAEQAQMVEDAINRKVDAIVLAPSQGSVLASSVRHAKATGIPVVIVDSPIAVTQDHYREFIGSDNARIGKLAADHIAHVLNGRGEIAILAVSPTVASSVSRTRAFIKEIDSNWPTIKVIDIQYGLSNPHRSESLTADLLAAHPHLRAIFALDAFATRGAFAALMAAHAQESVKLVGVAQEVDMLDQVRNGNIEALVVQDPYQMGYLAISALEHPTGKTHVTLTQVVLATKQNVDEPAIRRLWSHYSDQNSSSLQ